MNRWTRISITVGVVLLVLFICGYGWTKYSDRRKLNQLVANMRNPPADSAPTRGPEGFRAMRNEVNSLPEPLQREFRQSMQGMFMSREEKRLDAFFALSKVQRQKELDKQIAEDEKRKKEWEQRRQQNNGSQAAGNGGPGGNQGQGGQGGRGGGPGGGGGRGGQGARLDSTSPTFRAKSTAYRQEMNQRRAEQGLPPQTGRGGGGGGRGGRGPR